MFETWQFDYEGRIFATPVISLPIVERAIEELEWVVERGAARAAWACAVRVKHS